MVAIHGFQMAADVSFANLFSFLDLSIASYKKKMNILLECLISSTEAWKEEVLLFELE